MLCVNVTKRLKGMIDTNKHEEAALAAAAQAGGVFVELTGKTDLVTWTAEEWGRLVDVIVTEFQDTLRRAYSEDPPF